VCGCSSMVESQPSKLAVWVRFPSPAPIFIGVVLELALFVIFLFRYWNYGEGEV
jgi:hypothetical protein